MSQVMHTTAAIGTAPAVTEPALAVPLLDPERAQRDGLRRSPLAPLLIGLYKLVRGHKRWRMAGLVFNLLKRVEGGRAKSYTSRQLLARYHGVEVGAYSYGECMIPGWFPKCVTIGRYSSIAAGVRVYNQNHPIDHLSTHPYFYDPGMRLVKSDPPRHRLMIGHDVWIGVNAIITPGCRRIGNGAVVGAGAVVTKDVEDFAIVAGNPAKLIRHRFPADTRDAITASQWWDQPIDTCAKSMETMTAPVSEELLRHPLLQPIRLARGGTNGQAETE
jgi:virginiamycin A acetyltransferase